MITYTISLDFIENLKGDADHRFILHILLTILNSNNSHKIAIDKDGLILKKYMAVVNPVFKAEIALWVNYIGIFSSSVQKTNASIASIKNEKKMCLEICEKTRGSKKLIIYSFDYHDDIDDNNCISYNGRNLPVIDKDAADKEINCTNIINYNVNAKKSKVAINGIIN